MSKQEYLTAKGVAERWGIPYHVVLQARKAGKIKEELKPGRDIIFKVNKITKMMDKITTRWILSKKQKRGRTLEKPYRALQHEHLNLMSYLMRDQYLGCPLQSVDFRPLDLRAYLQSKGISADSLGYRREPEYLRARIKINIMVKRLSVEGYKLAAKKDILGFLDYCFELGILGIMVRDSDGSRRYYLRNKDDLYFLLDTADRLGWHLIDLWSPDEGCFRIDRILAIMCCEDHAIATLSGNIKIWYRGKRSKRSEAIVLSVHEQVNEIRKQKGLPLLIIEPEKVN